MEICIHHFSLWGLSVIQSHMCLIVFTKAGFTHLSPRIMNRFLHCDNFFFLKRGMLGSVNRQLCQRSKQKKFNNVGKNTALHYSQLFTISA